jgi:5-methyltetrahydrofolate--homocysteine methyltransferase
LLTANEEVRTNFSKRIKDEYSEMRDRRSRSQKQKNLISIDAARQNKFVVAWSKYDIPTPKSPGIHVFESLSIRMLIKYIDWTPFFTSWELAGKFPAILEDSIVGAQCKSLYKDAREMLDKLMQSSKTMAKAVIGIFPAQSDVDDIILYNEHGEAIERLSFLRQQVKKAAGRPNHCLSDYIASVESGKMDYMGAFAVTAGIGIQEMVEQFENNHDDYSAILLKAVADRLAEAAAEYMHKKVRKEIWGYTATEHLTNIELISEKYQGIRPAPGYPACPEHTEKAKLFNLLQVDQTIGISLTENYAMLPAASVSGWYFSHPDSKYFGIQQIGYDQLADYASRKGWNKEEAERWLAPVIK